MCFTDYLHPLTLPVLTKLYVKKGNETVCISITEPLWSQGNLFQVISPGYDSNSSACPILSTRHRCLRQNIDLHWNLSQTREIYCLFQCVELTGKLFLLSLSLVWIMGALLQR